MRFGLGVAGFDLVGQGEQGFDAADAEWKQPNGRETRLPGRCSRDQMN